jgi:glucose/arabinose dehydrogenase
MVQNGSKLPGPVIDLRRVVLNQGDRGLLDVAVDPNFASNRCLYFIYVVDPDSNMVDTNDDAYSRLVRYQLPIGSNVVDTTTRAVLFGRSWPEGPPSGSVSHTDGSLRWGADGSLIVSIGDGAQFDGVDEGGDDPGLFQPGRTDPLENIGAFRAQYVGSLAGKILRLDPATGLGYPSNPFYDGNPASVRSRVYAYGLRNPFRLCVRPGTGNTDPSQGRPGSIYLGDVGWDTWEELSIATQPGMNFGWPCREGLHTTAYVTAMPAHSGCSSLGTPNNPATVFTPPVSDWNHFTSSQSNPAGVVGNAASGSVFYEGTRYPAAYQGRYMFADYGQSWIRLATVDANDNIITFTSFGDDMDNPVDLVSDPISKDIHYVSISTGQVRRIRYFGSPNGTPVAMASAAPLSGGIPLSVSFSSAGSSDPNGDPLEFIWDFGEGSGSFETNPTHVYTMSGAFAPTLTVSDGHGGYNTKALQVTVGDPGPFPGTPVLDDFNRPNGSLGAPWSNTSGAAIASNQLKASASTSEPLWTGTLFGPDQEAYYTFANASGGEFHINLKLQYGSASASHIEVTTAGGTVRVSTFDDTGVGWVMRGPPVAVSFNTGDQFGARVYGSTVHIFKNGALVGSRSIAGWQFVNSPGYIGLAMINANSNSRLDNFGGGNFVPAVNTSPTAIIASPSDNAFYIEGQAITLTGNASDGQTTAAQMGYHWDVTLHHNNHTHPGQLVSDNRNDVFLPESHEDGTGTWLETRLVVTDGGGLMDTASVALWPEVDLDPSPVTVTPDPARRIDVNQFTFKLRNYGRMLSRRSHWALLAGSTLLAEGDTLVAALDSLTLSVPVDIFLGSGAYPLRVVSDTLGVVNELNETNNVKMRTLTVLDGPVAVQPSVPAFASLSAGVPNPTRRTTRFWLALPRSEQVSMVVHDVQGRRVWSGAPREYGPGRWELVWDARDQPPGVYLLQMDAGLRRWIRRIAVIR